jgi:hypothetical protein
MAHVSPTQVAPSDEITAASVNTPNNQLADAINGNIDDTNLASAAVTTAKIADDAVTAGKIDFGGGGTGVWWEEIGRTTLGVAGDTISVTGLTTKKYLRIEAYVSATGGTVAIQTRLNADSGNNYARRSSSNGGADATATASNYMTDSGVVATDQFLIAQITNVLAKEKICSFQYGSLGAAGTGTAPTRIEGFGKWVNTAAAISGVSVVNIAGTGDFAIGSELVVLGHD